MSKKWIALFICTHIAVILLTALIVDGFFKEKSYAESERQRNLVLSSRSGHFRVTLALKVRPLFLLKANVR
jgi:hypothetical protein